MSKDADGPVEGGGGWKPSRGLVVAMVFLAAFFFLQFAEVIWRHLSPSSAKATPSSAEATEGVSRPVENEGVAFPEIRREGDLVTVRSGGNRTRIRLDEGDDPQALVECIRTGLEQALGRSADAPAGSDAPPMSRRQVTESVNDVTQRCIAEANGLAPTPPPPPPPPPAPQQP